MIERIKAGWLFKIKKIREDLPTLTINNLKTSVESTNKPIAKLDSTSIGSFAFNQNEYDDVKMVKKISKKIS